MWSSFGTIFGISFANLFGSIFGSDFVADSGELTLLTYGMFLSRPSVVGEVVSAPGVDSVRKTSPTPRAVHSDWRGGFPNQHPGLGTSQLFLHNSSTSPKQMTTGGSRAQRVSKLRAFNRPQRASTSVSEPQRASIRLNGPQWSHGVQASPFLICLPRSATIVPLWCVSLCFYSFSSSF